jgi:MFS family permease
MATIFYGWWVVLACFLIAFYAGGALFFGLTAFFEPIVEESGWSYTLVSIAFSLRGFEMGMLAPITGFLVDRFGSRKLTLSGTLIVGVALILLGLTKSLGMFYGAFFLLAVGTSGCSSTVLMTAVVHWFKRNLGKAMGIVVCGFGAGGILIPVIVWLINLYQWRTASIILGLGMWAVGIPLSVVIRHTPEQYGYLPNGETPGDPSSIVRDGGRGQEVKVREALKSKNFWMIGCAEAIRMMITVAATIHVMPYLGSISMPRTNAASVATSIPLLSIIGRLGFGWLGDIIDKKYALATVYCFLGVGILAFSYVHVKWLIVPFLLLFCPGFGGSASLRGVVVREYFGRVNFGGLYGIMMGVAAIGGIIGPSAAGWTFDNFGTYQPVWLFFAGTAAIAVVLILRLKAPTRITGE